MHITGNRYDEFGNCTQCGGGEDGSIEHMVWCPVEGANPPIYCGESIPKKKCLTMSGKSGRIVSRRKVGL